MLSSPAAARNRDPILEVLRERLPPRARVLEVASGSGEHAVWISRALPEITWTPSDRDAATLAGLEVRRAAEGPPNLLPPLRLDASEPADRPDGRFEAVVCINMIHIAPWAAAEGLMALAAAVLPQDGLLYLYGPFREGGRHTAPSNEAFDQSLRARDPTWGVRDLETVTALAERHGLTLAERVEMPANNLSVVFRKA